MLVSKNIEEVDDIMCLKNWILVLPKMDLYNQNQSTYESKAEYHIFFHQDDLLDW